MAKTTLAERLRGYLTPTAPLGPSDASQIRDVEVAARLFDPHNDSFNTLLRRDLSVLIGRRGSGKTALLNSYTYRPFLDKYFKPHVRSAASDYRSYDLVIAVETYKHFDDMQQLVVRDPKIFRPVEAIVDDWESIVTDFFFAKLVSEELEAGRKSAAIERLRDYLHQDEDDYKRQVREMVWGVGLLDRLRQLMHLGGSSHAQRMNREDALALAVEHLDVTKRRALIVFDSMDQYDIRNSVFNRTLAALIRFISQFNSRQDRIRIKLVLPSEIFPEISRASANPLKDFTSVDQLSWAPTELEQIAAHRYRLFLELYDPDLSVELSDLDLSKRAALRSFWARFFPPSYKNVYDVIEDPMTYVLRHTQLLPRQFLMILQKIIVTSASTTGGYREFKRGAIASAIEVSEPWIANEILRAFSHIYPIAEEFARPVFANFPTIFSYEQLEDKWRKKGRPVARVLAPEFDTPQFTEMLVRMGIIGIGHGETDRYYEGEFGYDSLEPKNVGERHALCLHPIFSKYFNASGNQQKKAVMPRGLTAAEDGAA